jgi:hypothetical protein
LSEGHGDTQKKRLTSEVKMEIKNIELLVKWGTPNVSKGTWEEYIIEKEKALKWISERLDDFHEHEQGKYWVYIAIGHNVGIVG